MASVVQGLKPPSPGEPRHLDAPHEASRPPRAEGPRTGSPRQLCSPAEASPPRSARAVGRRTPSGTIDPTWGGEAEGGGCDRLLPGVAQAPGWCSMAPRAVCARACVAAGPGRESSGRGVGSGSSRQHSSDSQREQHTPKSASQPGGQ